MINRTVLFAPTSDSKKCVPSISKHVVTDSEEAVLVKVLNFSVMYPHSNLDMAFAVESLFQSFHRLGMEFRWKIWSMLEKSVFHV
jgi:hypothetical protein